MAEIAEVLRHRSQKSTAIYAKVSFEALRATGLRALTYSTLLGFLASTGLPPGDALALDRSDVDLANGILSIRQTKFGKSRFVPVEDSTRRPLSPAEGQQDLPKDPRELLVARVAITDDNAARAIGEFCDRHLRRSRRVQHASANPGTCPRPSPTRCAKPPQAPPLAPSPGDDRPPVAPTGQALVDADSSSIFG